MIEAGDKSRSTVATRRTQAALLEISKLTTGVAVANQVTAIPTVD
jgi:hypothetical protein